MKAGLDKDFQRVEIIPHVYMAIGMAQAMTTRLKQRKMGSGLVGQLGQELED